MRTPFWRLALAVAALMAAVVAPALSQSESVPKWATTLVGSPGVELGPVRIGSTKAMVHMRLGMPDEIGRDSTDTYWTYDVGTDAYVVSWSNSAPGVDFLHTLSARATVAGIIPGTSTLRDVLERFGPPDRLGGSSFSMTFTYRRGVRFLITPATQVIRGIEIVPADRL